METENVLLEAERDYQKQYRKSKWWIEHRDALRRAGIVAFIVVDAAFLAFAGWTFADAYLIRYADETRAVLEMAAYGQADLHSYTLARAAKSLKVVTPVATISSEGKYDLSSTVTNPNRDWWAEFTYVFESTAGKTEEAVGFVLPDSSKPVAAYAIPSSASPRSLALTITDVSWHHIDHHVTGDPAAWIANRVGFEVTDATFESIELDGNIIGRISFSVRNATAYGYYDPLVTVLLMRGSSVVGVTGTTISSLGAGESQNVAINWFGPIPNVNKVDPIVEVNPFDMESYKALAGETTEDTRVRVRLRR